MSKLSRGEAFFLSFEGGPEAASGFRTLQVLILAPVAGALCGLLEAFMALTRPGLALEGVGPTVGFFLVAMAAGCLLGVLMGSALALALVLLGGVDKVLKHWLFVLVFLALLIFLNRGLFKGGTVSKHPLLPLFVGAALGCAGLCSYLAVRLVPYFLRRGGKPRLRGTAWLLVGLLLLFSNGLFLPGLYPAIHRQEVGLSLLALLLGLLLVGHGRSRKETPARWFLCFLLLLPLPLVLGRSRAFRLGAAVLASRGEGASVLLLPVAERLGLLPHAAAVRAATARLAALFHLKEGRRSRALLDSLRKRGPLDLLLVALDTVRADAVGFMGHRPSPTPLLDKLAASGVVFEQALTPYPTSAWAYSAILHGVHARRSLAAQIITQASWKIPLDHSLGGLLAKSGYWTLASTAFNARSLSDPQYFGHLKPGFSVFNPRQREVNANARQVTDDFLAALRKRPAKPLFGFIHYLDAHAPYRAPPAPGETGSQARYLGGILREDRELGRVLKHVDLQRTIVVAFADHGEEFLEHGGRFHDSSLYQEQVHVPLLIKIPGLLPRRVHAPVSLVDLLPTLLRLLGIKDPYPRSGRSLVPFLVGEAGEGDGLACSELFTFSGRSLVPEQQALWSGPWKLIVRQETGTRELYNLSRDPAEHKNLIGLQGTQEKDLLGLLGAMNARIDGLFQQPGAAPEAPPVLFRRRTRELIRSLLETRGKGGTVAVRLANHLFDPYGEPTLAASQAYTKPELTALIKGLLQKLAPNHPYGLAQLIYLVGKARLKRLLPELKTLWNQGDQRLRLPLAISLALFGDNRGRGVLYEALARADPVRPLAAIALGALGDRRGVAWLVMNLMAGPPLEWAATLRILPHSGLPDPTRFVMERLIDTLDCPEGVARAALVALAPDPSENATVLLLRLAVGLHPRIREAAHKLLERRLDPARLRRELAASAAAKEGDMLVRGKHDRMAAARFREALRKSRLFRSALRLRLAATLRLEGAPTQARKVLQEVQARAPESWYREDATRELLFVGEPVLLNPQTFGVAVRVRRPPPASLPAGRSYAVGLVLTNTGSVAWTGGPGPGGVALKIMYESAAGQLVEGQGERLNWLPLAGVLAGEEVAVEVAATGPAQEGLLRPVLVFQQTDARLKDRGIVKRL